MKQFSWYIVNRLLVAVISSILLGLFFLAAEWVRAWYVPRDPTLGSIWMTALSTQFYAIPVYVFAGVPCSLLIDGIMHGVRFHSSISRYFIHLILYAGIGILIIVLIQHRSQSGTIVYIKPTPVADALRVACAGALPALLFYHTTLLLRWVTSKSIYRRR